MPVFLIEHTPHSPGLYAAVAEFDKGSADKVLAYVADYARHPKDLVLVFGFGCLSVCPVGLEQFLGGYLYCLCCSWHRLWCQQ